MFGTSDVIEGVGDITSGITCQGLDQKSYNPVRDTLFGGNELIYAGTEILASAGTSAAVSKALAAPAVREAETAGNAGESVNKATKIGKGRLIGKLDGLTADERRVINDLLESGSEVEIIPRSDIVKTPDFRINGIKTELKTLNGNSLNTPITRIQDGFKQGAESVIIDARKTDIGIEQARTILGRAIGVYNGKLPGKVEIWTEGGKVIG